MGVVWTKVNAVVVKEAQIVAFSRGGSFVFLALVHTCII
jgi:hypothetical protein